MKRRKKNSVEQPSQSEKKTRKFAGEICSEIPIEDLRKDDYIMYWDSGHRVAKVLKNHKGYKHRWVKLYPSIYRGYVLRRSKKIKPKLIRSVWRKVEDIQEETTE